MVTNNYFPLDILAVKSYGIKKWQEEFFWPLPYEHFIQTEVEIRQLLNEFIQENAGNYISDLLLINYKLFIEYNNFLNSLKVLKELNKNGLKPLYGDESINFKGIVENGIPLRRLLTVPVVKKDPIITRLRRQAGMMKWFFKLNKSLISLLNSVFHKGPFIANYSSLSNFSREYILAKLNDGIIFKEAHDWCRGFQNKKLSVEQKQQLNLLTNALVNGIKKIAMGNELVLNKSQYAYLHDITLESFVITMKCLEVLKNRISKLKPLHILIGSSGNRFARMLSSVVRNHGGFVTGFKHGEPIVYLWDETTWLELSTVDQFCMYTHKLAHALKKVMQEYPPIRNNRIEVIGGETKQFYNIWSNESKKPIPSKIKKVMILANAFRKDNDMIHQAVPLPPLVQLDLEFNIMNTLHKGGYEILYKRHPDGIVCGQSTISFSNDIKIIDGRYEDVMDLADAFLFYYTRTSTLGSALCTNKPIIFIDGGWERWLPEMWKLFEKRCRIVPAKFDNRNRLIIDEKELIDALQHKPQEPNTEFLHEFMFPDGEKS